MTPIKLNPAVEAIPVYPTASTYEFGGELAKLASNESPFSPHPAVAEAITAAGHDANRYPDPSGSALRDALAKTYDVAAEQIVLGNGSCEILLAAAQVMLEPGAEIVYAWPSFSMYPQLAAMTGAKAVEVPLTDDFKHDLPAMAAAVNDKTRIVLVCNPNNPTSTFVEHAEVAAFIRDLPSEVCVIVDEAYIEFAANAKRDELLPLVIDNDNVVITRTFAKVFGLAGLRIGYGFSSLRFKQAVDVVRQPFSVNLVAQAAAREALNHPDDVAKRVQSTLIERNWVEGSVRGMGLRTAQTQANFSWIDLGERDENAIVDGLAKQGVIVRAGSALGATGFIRVSYGERPDNERFVSSLAGLLD
ncbi:MAG TPA: histidinol-phosphate transaminase [Solirubrobacterales bacterium]|jgi:histidinol-phosphate aminotransferase|nr:histidinol-phosphate transaminase [Solirubrobacterales bacterium]